MAKPKGWSSEDWYKDGEGQLHFFPHANRIAWTVGRRILFDAEGWGGATPKPGVKYDTMKPQPTTPGTYVVQDHGPYTTATWELSRIPWGAALKVHPDGEHLLYQGGAGGGAAGWNRVDKKVPTANVAWIKGVYKDLYGKTGIYDSNGDGIPDKWVFNDFGPWAVRYFRDLNRNRKLDGAEELMGEMIHTTPENEAQTARALPVGLEPSHGCIHIKPFDRDKFLKGGAFASGNLLVVHGPSEVVPEFLSR
jgi:hypothetical protein